MPIDLYYVLGSPPCRTVMMLAKDLKVDLNLKVTNLMAGDNKTPAYLKMNPQHAIPTLDDNGFGLGERQYKMFITTCVRKSLLTRVMDLKTEIFTGTIFFPQPRHSTLPRGQICQERLVVPQGRKKRAIVDQRLDFDAGHLYNGFVTYYLVPILNTGKVGEKYWLDKLQENFNILNNILEGETWVAGNSITIADYAIAITVSTVELMGFDISKYSNVTKWYAKVQKAIPSYKEINDEGSKQLKEFFSQFQNHAILGYLADKYSKDDSLYPKDVNKRGLVNNRLFFDIGTLYAGFFGYYVPVLRTGKLGDPSFKTKIDEGFELLNTFLEGENWVAGSNLTIADYSIVATVASFDVLGYEVNKWKNVSEWYKRAQQTMAGYDEINGEGCRILKQFFDQLLK
ncbi:hypothetical protein ANN_15964 [Periplaneta americana]|uniref:Uncharacterized protein n=1 Tax=Periplaneta americana TaxID=6978 RepID=A0ABQ8SIE5_PERAM|nr:hypothetical protein ANN_15964 [Periplaneta americana]